MFSTIIEPSKVKLSAFPFFLNLGGFLLLEKQSNQALLRCLKAYWGAHNDSYCIVGVTCMVRDLIPQLGEDLIEVMSKDDQGRPLYVFVGYVAQLSQDKDIHNFPPYEGDYLNNFKSLYQEIEKVWLVKNYESEGKSPLSSQYQRRNFAQLEIANNKQQILQLNYLPKSPDQTYLSPSLPEHNNRLWLTSMQCPQPTSTCLNIKGKALVNSPFLNQTGSQVEKFQIKNRMVPTEKHKVSKVSENKDYQGNSSLSQKISDRAKEDLDLTLQQAGKVATAGQDLINNFTDWSTQTNQTNQWQANSEQLTDSPSNEPENFGFKTKKSSASNKQDWF